MLSSPAPVHILPSRKIWPSFAISVTKCFVTGLLLFLPDCKLVTPDSFLDPTPDSNELLKTMNVRHNGELWSGVVAGDLPAGVTGVEVRFDEGAWKKAEVTGNRWRVFIPTGAEAATGKQRWQVGSKHALELTVRGPGGNKKSMNTVSLAFSKQLNKDSNGDGYSDLVIGGSRNQGVGANDKGVAYVFYGSVSGAQNQPTAASAYICSGPGETNNCSVIQNPENEASGFFASAVAFAGDANGDGYADLLVGAPGNQGAGAADKGVVYIFYGSSSGVVNQPTTALAYTCAGQGSVNNCSVIQNPDDEATGNFGTAVASAGDVNGDGYSDLIVGAISNQGTGASNKGVAYVFYGSASGLVNQVASSAPYVCSGSGTPNSCNVIQNPDDEITGQFGIAVSSAGDVNGDTYSDVIVGALRNQGSGATDKGVVYIFYGSANGVTNQPTGATPYICTGPGASNNCSVIQNPDDELTGRFGASIAPAGDVNNDSYADVIVGAFNNQGGGATDKGVVFIYYGSAAGVTNQATSTTPYTCTGPGAVNNCSVIQNPDDEATGQFGYSVAYSGDVNGDGFGDLIVGAKSNQGAGAINKGVAYIFYGSISGTINQSPSASPYSCGGPQSAISCSVIQNPDNESAGEFGYSVGSAGDLNGDGFIDVIIGARGNQGTGASDKGSAYVFYGNQPGVMNQTTNTVPYACTGPGGGNKCSVIQNPDDETNGLFGSSVGSLAPALRHYPARLEGPSPVRRSNGIKTSVEALAILPNCRRDEELA